MWSFRLAIMCKKILVFWSPRACLSSNNNEEGISISAILIRTGTRIRRKKWKKTSRVQLKWLLETPAPSCQLKRYERNNQNQSIWVIESKEKKICILLQLPRVRHTYVGIDRNESVKFMKFIGKKTLLKMSCTHWVLPVASLHIRTFANNTFSS